MLDILIPIVTFVVGIIIGGIGATFFIKNKMKNLLNDPKQIQSIAKSMGYNLNQKQMNLVAQNIKKQKSTRKKKK